MGANVILDHVFTSIFVLLRSAIAPSPAAAAIAAVAAAETAHEQGIASGYHRQKFRQAFAAYNGGPGTVWPGRVCIATGFRFGDRSYTLDGMRTRLLLRAVLVADPGSPIEHIDQARLMNTSTGSSSWQPVTAKALMEEGASSTSSYFPGPSTARVVEEIEVPLSAVMDEAPDVEMAENVWVQLWRTDPLRFGEIQLQQRRQNLRRAAVASASTSVHSSRGLH